MAVSKRLEVPTDRSDMLRAGKGEDVSSDLLKIRQEY